MPIEGLENTDPAATPDAVVNNTPAAVPGDGTQAGQVEGASDKKFTQADVDRIVQSRIKSGIKAELKKLTGDPEGGITLEGLQQQLENERSARHALEADQTLSAHLADPANKLNLKPENIPAIKELVKSRLVLDKDGKPTNLAEAIEAVKPIAPTLFALSTPSPADAAVGRSPVSTGVNMNEFVRRHAGLGN